MMLKEERQLVVDYGRKLLSHGLTKGTGGNLSLYNREKGLIAISPSGVDYLEMVSEDVPVVSLDGEVVQGSMKPSSELAMHTVFYKRRSDVSSIVHTHSRYAVTLACLNQELPPVHYLIGFAGKSVKCAEYATYGTEALAENAYNAMAGRKAVLLANHGLLAGGESLNEAFCVAEMTEFCAEVFWRAKCIGSPVVLPDSEMEVIMDKFKTYGKGDCYGMGF